MKLSIDIIFLTKDIVNPGKQPNRLGANSLLENGLINGNYTGQLDDIQVWDYFYKRTSSKLV